MVKGSKDATEQESGGEAEVKKEGKQQEWEGGTRRRKTKEWM